MLELNFKVTVRDYREAVYYALFLRRRGVFRVAGIVLLACFVYVVLSVNHVLTMEPVILFVACAYLIWVLLLLAKTEGQIAVYQKSPDSLLNVEYIACFDSTGFTVEIPLRSFKVSGSLAELRAAFELTNCFMIYVTAQQSFIIPTRDMTKAEAKSLRGILQDGLNDRFYSLFR